MKLLNWHGKLSKMLVIIHHEKVMIMMLNTFEGLGTILTLVDESIQPNMGGKKKKLGLLTVGYLFLT